jgi:hypothetical protein
MSVVDGLSLGLGRRRWRCGFDWGGFFRSEVRMSVQAVVTVIASGRSCRLLPVLTGLGPMLVVLAGGRHVCDVMEFGDVEELDGG